MILALWVFGGVTVFFTCMALFAKGSYGGDTAAERITGGIFAVILGLVWIVLAAIHWG